MFYVSNTLWSRLSVSGTNMKSSYYWQLLKLIHPIKKSEKSSTGTSQLNIKQKFNFNEQSFDQLKFAPTKLQILAYFNQKLKPRLKAYDAFPVTVWELYFYSLFMKQNE